MKTIVSLGCCAVLGTTLFAQQREVVASSLAITRVNVVDVERGDLLHNRTVVIKGDVIDSIMPGDAAIPNSVTTIDGRDVYLIPGLWDMRSFHRAGVKILAGTDAGAAFDFPGSDLHSELWHLVQAGLTPVEALRAAILDPATFVGLRDSLGTVAPKKIADLVLLEGNPLSDIANTRRIAAVVLRGRYYNRAALDELLAAAKQAMSAMAE